MTRWLGAKRETRTVKLPVLLGLTVALASGLAMVAHGQAGMSRPAEPLFRFIFCSDLHISTPGQSRGFAKVVDRWIEDSSCYDFVVVGGDLSINGSTAEFALVKNQLDRTKKPYFVLPGNHDVSGPGLRGSASFRKAFGLQQTNRLSHRDGYGLLFLDLADGGAPTVSVPEPTLRWAGQALPRLSKDLPVLVFSHFSLHPDVPRFPVSGTGAIFDMLDTLNVIACFSGNYHAFWQGVRNKAHYYNATCLSDAEDNHDGSPIEGFLWTSVYPDSVHVDFVEGGGLLPLSRPCR